jgi:quinol-cytochrome oxidoreductase complex cytochrome b subunit
MSQRYTSEGVQNKKKGENTHPIWRGIGILLIVLLPVMGYLGAMVILDENKRQVWFRVPHALLVPGPDNLLLVKVILTIAIAAILYFIIMMITFIIFRIVSPPKLGPTDAPPVQWKTKTKK